MPLAKFTFPELYCKTPQRYPQFREDGAFQAGHKI
jgi:hypothetical protein